MLELRITEEEMKLLISILDTDLRNRGLEALPRVVALHNVLTSAKKVNEESEKGT